MIYYVGNVACDSNYLEHFGTKGMKWGVRRYQNPDGTLTEAGKKRYGRYGYQEVKGDFIEKKYQRRINKQAAKANKASINLNVKSVENKDPRRASRKLTRMEAKLSDTRENLKDYQAKSPDEKKAIKKAVIDRRIKRGMKVAVGIAAGASLAISALSYGAPDLHFTMGNLDIPLRYVMLENVPKHHF